MKLLRKTLNNLTNKELHQVAVEINKFHQGPPYVRRSQQLQDLYDLTSPSTDLRVAIATEVLVRFIDGVVA